MNAIPPGPARRHAGPAPAGAALGLLILASGCTPALVFPADPLHADAAAGTSDRLDYDTDADGRPDYFLMLNPQGRATAIGYDSSGAGRPDHVIHLDRLTVSDCRHIVIILDGCPYDVVKEFQDEGRLRLFHPSSRVVAPYPVMTDICLEDLLGYVPCRGYEAAYYDRPRQRLTDGSGDYLRMRNEPWVRLADYRAHTLWDVVSYLYPRWVFRRELRRLKAVIDDRLQPEILAYLVSTAGVGTRGGRDGMRYYLTEIDRLVQQVVWETRGLVKVTVMSDHGHTLVPPRHIALDEHLAKRGWRLTHRLAGPRDVVDVRFGLVTYATFMTRDPRALADDVLALDGTDLASYMEGDGVVVRSRHGEALIRAGARGYRYEIRRGDPLALNPIVERLRKAGQVDAEGFIDDRALFEATLTHRYPDPLHRLHRAFFGLVHQVPDLIVSLEPAWHSGSAALDAFVTNASTHGDLGYGSSTAFIMSTAGPLPPALRSRDVPAGLSRLLGRPFPYAR